MLAALNLVAIAAAFAGEQGAFFAIFGVSIIGSWRLRAMTVAALKKDPDRFERQKNIGRLLFLSVFFMWSMANWCETFTPHAGRFALLVFVPTAPSVLFAAAALVRALRGFVRKPW
jgi:hypothetical protein